MHALDYITTFDRTVTGADPCAGVAGCGGTPSTFPIPTDPNVTNAGVTQLPGDAGRFDLRIDGAAPNAGSLAVGTGGTTGAVALQPGVYTVGEVAAAGSPALTNYTTSIVCDNDPAVAGPGPRAVTLARTRTSSARSPTSARPGSWPDRGPDPGIPPRVRRRSAGRRRRPAPTPLPLSPPERSPPAAPER